MSQHVGFYEVIQDELVTLPQANGNLDKVFTFTPPANTATDNRSVLTFMVGIKGANNLKFRISLNGVGIVALNQEGNYKGFVQEVIQSGLIKPGVANMLACNIVGGSGSITFSDMVVTYQRNI